MDGVILLQRARESGLAVAAEGDKLIIRGPKRAEPVARLLIENKPKVIAALLVIDASWWRREFIVRTFDYLLDNRTHEQAERLAFGRLIVEWHRLHGAKVAHWQCAGCGRSVGGLPALDLADGARVHLDDLHGVACLIAYGERWREAATAALTSIGLEPPVDDGEDAP